MLFTFGLVLTVLNVAATKAIEGNSFYGLAIGSANVIGTFVDGPISGGAFNPAVGFGATLASAAFHGGSWSDLWPYVVGPLVGGAAAAAVHHVQVGGMERSARPGARPGEPPQRAAAGGRT